MRRIEELIPSTTSRRSRWILFQRSLNAQAPARRPLNLDERVLCAPWLPAIKSSILAPVPARIGTAAGALSKRAEAAQ